MRANAVSTSATLALLGAILGAACNRAPDAPPRTPTEGLTLQVSAQRVEGGIRIMNDTDGRIAYALIEREYFERALAIYGPCHGCLLQARESVIVPIGAIHQYQPGDPEAVLVWWRLVPHPDGDERLEGPQDVVVRL